MIKSVLFRSFKFYERCLKERPKTTNAVMTGTLFGVGDISAQLLFPTELQLDDARAAPLIQFDLQRMARSVIYGSLIFSFIGDRWFRFLNNRVKFGGLRPSHWSNMLLRVGVDQLGFAPISLTFYYMCMTLMEGGTINMGINKIKNQWWDTLVTNWAVWPAFQCFNFTFVPLQHRLLALNVVAIFWNTFLSYTNSHAPSDLKLPVNVPPTME